MRLRIFEGEKAHTSSSLFPNSHLATDRSSRAVWDFCVDLVVHYTVLCALYFVPAALATLDAYRVPRQTPVRGKLTSRESVGSYVTPHKARHRAKGLTASQVTGRLDLFAGIEVSTKALVRAIQLCQIL